VSAIAEMRERVTLQSPMRAADGAGGADVSWTDAAIVWAKVEEGAGGERLTGERLAAQAAHQITQAAHGCTPWLVAPPPDAAVLT